MTHKTTNIPVGDAFLQYAFGQRDGCERISRKQLQNLGDNIPETIIKLGTVLSLSDRLSSCYWGCHGLEHTIEYLVCRMVSSALAAIRLIEFGHYDEALGLTRSIAEIGNLMELFRIAPETIRQWSDLSERDRGQEFNPAQVRKKLKDKNNVVLTDSKQYRLLCAIGIHANPDVLPQSHNAHQIPNSGGYYQERGHVVCINELSWAVVTVTGPAAKIAVVAEDKATMIVEAVISLAQSIGKVRLQNKRSLTSYREHTSSSQELLKTTERRIAQKTTRKNKTT